MFTQFKRRQRQKLNEELKGKYMDSIYRQLEICIHEMRLQASHASVERNEKLSRFLNRKAKGLEEKIEQLIKEYTM